MNKAFTEIARRHDVNQHPARLLDKQDKFNDHSALACRDLAMEARKPFLVVLYKLYPLQMNGADPENPQPDIETFYVRQMAPNVWQTYQTMTPYEYAQFIYQVRLREIARLINLAKG